MVGGKKCLEISVNGNITGDGIQIAESFNSYFVESVQTLQQSSPMSMCPVDHNQPVFELCEITKTKVTAIINSLKNSRTQDVCGLDRMFLKSFNECLSGPILTINNRSYSGNVFPGAWKEAIIAPIYTAGKISEVENYRPISILPVLSKIAEKQIAEQLRNQLSILLSFHGTTSPPILIRYRKTYLRVKAEFSSTRGCSFGVPMSMLMGEKLTVVPEYKYLGIKTDSNLTFKQQIKSVVNIAKFHLSNFRHIRNSLSTKAAVLYFNAIIMSHLSYCLTRWAQATREMLIAIA